MELLALLPFCFLIALLTMFVSLFFLADNRFCFPFQLHGQHQMQFSQSLGHQQFQGRQLPSGHVQHGIGQSQLNQGNQMNRLSQFSGPANSALFSAAQATPNTQMV